MKQLTMLLGIAIATPLSAQRGLPARAAAAKVADSLAKAFVANGSSPSVAIALMRGNDTILVKAYGAANLELETPATTASVYRVGSVTKQFTSAAVMQLVEAAKIRLDDSIAAYLPRLPAAWRAVTIRQLLNHTSGIPSYTDIGMSWVRRWGEEMSPDTLVALTATAPMWFAPGTKWQYDNTGYILLGMLIEKVSGRPWEVELTERFFKPFGLANTRNCLTTPLIPHRVTGYSKENGEWVNAPYLAMTQPYAAGALCSTVTDLLKWNRALHTGRVVSPSSYAAMTTPAGAAALGALAYGFGLGRDTLAGQTVITHGGGIHGFATGNAWVPGARLSVTVLTNASGAPAGELLKNLVRAALGVPLVQR